MAIVVVVVVVIVVPVMRSHHDRLQTQTAAAGCWLFASGATCWRPVRSADPETGRSRVAAAIQPTTSQLVRPSASVVVSLGLGSIGGQTHKPQIALACNRSIVRLSPLLRINLSPMSMAAQPSTAKQARAAATGQGNSLLLLLAAAAITSAN